MTRSKQHVSHPDLLRTTRALLKFWRDHGYPEYGREKLSACVSALEADDFQTALSHFQAIPFGAKGYFGDWIPPAENDPEARKYEWEVLNALTERTVARWRAAADDQRLLKQFMNIQTGCVGWLLGGLLLYLGGLAAGAAYVLLDVPTNWQVASMVSAGGIAIGAWLLRS